MGWPGMVGCFCVSPVSRLLLALRWVAMDTAWHGIDRFIQPAPSPPAPCMPKTNNTHPTRVTAFSSSPPSALPLATGRSLALRFFPPPSPYPTPGFRDRLSSHPPVFHQISLLARYEPPVMDPGRLLPRYPSPQLA
ncbi:hypothetical protein LZ31DRAFT_553495, partial [Colletotrichum somersetense]